MNIRTIKTYYNDISELDLDYSETQLMDYPSDGIIKKGHLYNLHQNNVNRAIEPFLALYVTDKEEYIYFPKYFKFPNYVKQIHQYSNTDDDGIEYIYRFFDIMFPDSKRTDEDVVFQELSVKGNKAYILVKDTNLTFPLNKCYIGYFDEQFNNAYYIAFAKGIGHRDVAVYQRRLSNLVYPGYDSTGYMFPEIKVTNSPIIKRYQPPPRPPVPPPRFANEERNDSYRDEDRTLKATEIPAELQNTRVHRTHPSQSGSRIPAKRLNNQSNKNNDIHFNADDLNI